MTQGANAPLSAVRVSVEVTCRQPVDVSGILLTKAGKVRSDADLVFFNAPRGPGVVHRPASGAAPDAITVDTWAVPADVATIVIVAGLDDQHAAQGSGFAGAEPTTTVRDADSGQPLYTFTPPRLTRETAVVVVEIYRRGAEWKVRAVGQGYANGLAGIATDFGVSIDEPGHDTMPPMPDYAPTTAAPTPPAVPPRPTAPPAAPPTAASAAPRVTLDKGRVSLVKGGSVSLVKGGRPLLTSVRMALGWEPAKRGRNVDLDASCIAFDAQRERLETVWFMKLNVFNGAIQHTGDNLTGGGDGDDEAIDVHLEGLPPEVCGLAFVVNSFSGQRFTEVKDAYCRLLDLATGDELVRFDLTNAEPHTGVVMCKLVRQYSGEWVMTALGEYVDAKTARGMVSPSAALL
ncbi:TerD family protein [Kitasatospora sp. NBC_01266]|uniref:TerD family protein n=1 Tax=Kitasatospora sp. NBC_01266 TaxID=2903572 RepID=UPI002E38173B|nr:TerD family protein [Kitasatospora sp. NBC_01266]